jgi:hypothetical protein
MQIKVSRNVNDTHRSTDRIRTSATRFCYNEIPQKQSVHPMGQAMKAFAINAPTPEILKSFQDRKANIIRVTYNTGMALMYGAVPILALRVDLWFAIAAGAAAAIGGLLFIFGLCAAYEFARGPGWATASLTLPENSLTFRAGSIVMLACFVVMGLMGDKLGLSVSQWGLLGTCSWLVTNQLSGLCLFYLQCRKGEA